MRVLLIDILHRPALFNSPSWTPVLTPAAAARLRASGHEVRIVDFGTLLGPADGDRARSAVLSLAVDFHPDLVFVDLRAEALPALHSWGSALREGAPGAVIVAGGRHPTLAPGETLDFFVFLDAAVIGEVEEPLALIAGGAPLPSVPSVAFRDAGSVRRTPPAAPLPLDDLPDPAWDLLDMARWTAATPRVIPCLFLRTVSLETSRGCGSGCIFCAEGRQYGGAFRGRAPARVAAQAGKLRRDYGIEALYFTDENFLADRERVAALCDALRATGLAQRLRWSAQVRADTIDVEILAEMRAAGCLQLEFGIESGSPAVLGRLGKGSTVETHARALAMTRAAGIRSLASVMFALPGETAADLLETKEFLRRARPDTVRFVRYRPLPGTPLVKKLVAAGELSPGWWTERLRRSGRVYSPPDNFTAIDDRTLGRLARRIYRTEVLPRYLGDLVRRPRPLAFARAVVPGDIPPFVARKMRGRGYA